MADTSFRRRKADECIQAARLALEHELWETAVVRAYYCLFHALVMIMTRFNEPEPRRGWRHGTLRDRFEIKFCKRGFHFDRQDGETLNTALTARMDADYHDVSFDEKRASRVVERSRTLYAKALEVLDG